jgi:hypothetical protein
MENLDNTVKVNNGTASKTATNKVQNATKTKKKGS